MKRILTHMFIPIVIPTSVRTKRRWVIDLIEIPFLGGYLIMLIAFLPPFVVGLILSSILSSLSVLFLNSFWPLTIYLFGIIIFFWDKLLRSTFEIEISIILVPAEYYSYVFSVIATIFVYV